MRNYYRSYRRLTANILLVLALGSLHVTAAETVWQVELGTSVNDLRGHFSSMACGTNGGPPSNPLKSLGDFRICTPESGGLTEIYLRHDEEQEDRALALGQTSLAHRVGGTTLYDFPVVTSILVDGQGVVRAKRFVTDPRREHATARPRHEFWTLGNLLMSYFDRQGWNCSTSEPTAGEQAIGRTFIKRRCSKDLADFSLRSEQHYYQKKGQTFIDPSNGGIRPEDYESLARFEIHAVDISPSEEDTDVR